MKKGELLFEIDSRPYDAALASAKATHAQNEAILSLTKTELSRFQNAVASAAVSQLEFDQKKNAVLVAEARVEASKAAIDTAALNVEYTKIYSPIDGRAGARLVDPGNIVKENNTALLVIQKLDPTYAEFTVTENDLGTVRKYMAATGQKMGQPSSASPLKVEVDVPGDSARVLQALSEMPATSQPSTRRSKTATAPTSITKPTMCSVTMTGYAAECCKASANGNVMTGASMRGLYPRLSIRTSRIYLGDSGHD